MQVTDITVAEMRIICKYGYVDKSQTNVHNQLRNSGLRVTPARRAVLDLLQTMRKPLTATEIIGLLRNQGFDQATVYRTLTTLADQSLIRPISVKAGVMSYEAGSLPHHHHLVCERCGYVEDIHDCMLTAMPSPKASGFERVLDHALEFTGICRQCARVGA